MNNDTNSSNDIYYNDPQYFVRPVTASRLRSDPITIAHLHDCVCCIIINGGYMIVYIICIIVDVIIATIVGHGPTQFDILAKLWQNYGDMMILAKLLQNHGEIMMILVKWKVRKMADL